MQDIQCIMNSNYTGISVTVQQWEQTCFQVMAACKLANICYDRTLTTSFSFFFAIYLHFLPYTLFFLALL